MADDREQGGANRRDEQQRDEQQRESGEPGGGQGRRDTVGESGRMSGVHPMSAGVDQAKGEIRTEAGWGQGQRGAEGYEDAGGSELTTRDGQLIGGTTAGPGGEPTIDIHSGSEGEGARDARRAERRAERSDEEQRKRR